MPNVQVGSFLPAFHQSRIQEMQDDGEEQDNEDDREALGVISSRKTRLQTAMPRQPDALDGRINDLEFQIALQNPQPQQALNLPWMQPGTGPQPVDQIQFLADPDKDGAEDEYEFEEVNTPGQKTPDHEPEDDLDPAELQRREEAIRFKESLKKILPGVEPRHHNFSPPRVAPLASPAHTETTINAYMNASMQSSPVKPNPEDFTRVYATKTRAQRKHESKRLDLQKK